MSIFGRDKNAQPKNSAESSKDKREKKPINYFNVVLVILVIAVCALYFQNTTLKLKIKSNHDLILRKTHVIDDPTLFEKQISNALLHMRTERLKEFKKTLFEHYKNAPEKVPNGVHLYGSKDARFSLIEYSDLECPYCKKWHNTPLELANQSNGEINVIWKHFPLSFHNPKSTIESVAAECIAKLAGNRAFWAFEGQVFDTTRANGQGVPSIQLLSEQVGVSGEKLADCMKSNGNDLMTNVIEKNMDEGRQLGVQGTPSVLLKDNQTGKTQLLKGAKPAEAYLQAIQKMKLFK